MSTTHERDRSTLSPAVTAGVASSLLLGVLVFFAAHLAPSSVDLGDYQLNDLGLPLGLIVALGGVCLVGARTTQRSWRVVDIVVASVLGVAGGLVFVLWNTTYKPLGESLGALLLPLKGIYGGIWLFPAVLGGLVVRKPGAAVYTETVAATLSALIGNEWGFSTVWYGVVEGLGAEIVLAVLLYRAFNLPAALLAGAGAGVAEGALDVTFWYTNFAPGYQTVYITCTTISGLVIAGLGSWALARALARSGALAPLASGRLAERV